MIDRMNAALEGRYRIGSELGAGGMATVFLAEDLKHDRKVALKVLRPELAAVVGAERFLAEIRTTANLQHPHILPLFDSGNVDGRLFYVMPYVEGETLRERLARENQLPVDEAVRIAADVADALDYAHRHGVVHRDVKPANILIHENQPMVADFGIALAVSAAGGGRLTETGLSLGTPYYMSPEQATADRTPTPASDVYSLGAVLYEMLTGEPPYSGSSAQAVLGKILLGDFTSPTRLRHTIPPHVEAVVRRSLEKLPADRFGSAAEMARALKNPAFRHGDHAEAAGWAPRSGRWRTLALVTSAVAALAIGWGATRRGPPEAQVRYQVIAPDPIGDLGGAWGRVAALAPDGSSMVFPDTTGGTFRLAVKPSDSRDFTPLTGAEGAEDPVYSPDGEWLLFVVGSQLRKIQLRGGSAVTLAEDVPTGNVAFTWLDDGTIVHEVQLDTMVRIPEDGGEREVVFTVPLTQVMIDARPLPEARGVLVTVCDDGNCSRGSSLHLVDLEADTSSVLIDDAIRGWYVPTGHIVYVRRDGAVFGVPFDLDAMEFSGTGIPLLDRVRVSCCHADMLIGDDGTMVYIEGDVISSAESRLVWVDRSGVSEAVDPGAPLATYRTVALSPDDGELALSIRDTISEEIWVKALPGGAMTRLTNDLGRSRRPVWTADGESIAYIKGDEVALTYEPRMLRADGSTVGRSELLFERETPVLELLLTPDGNGSIFREGNADTGDADLGYVDRATGEVNDTLLASDFNERAIALSPNGEWLAYVSDVTGRDEVFVRPFPSTATARVQVSTAGGTEPVWAHSGRELFFRSAADSMVAAAYTTEPSFRVTDRQRLFDAGSYLNILQWHGYDVSLDDQRFLMVELGTATSYGSPDDRLIMVQNWFAELERLLGR